MLIMHCKFIKTVVTFTTGLSVSQTITIDSGKIWGAVAPLGPSQFRHPCHLVCLFERG